MNGEPNLRLTTITTTKSDLFVNDSGTAVVHNLQIESTQTPATTVQLWVKDQVGTEFMLRKSAEVGDGRVPLQFTGALNIPSGHAITGQIAAGTGDVIISYVRVS